MDWSDEKLQSVLESFEEHRIHLLQFMKAIRDLKDEYGITPDPELGTAVVGCFGRHTEGRDLMSCLLISNGFNVVSSKRGESIEDIVGRCVDPTVTVLCLSVQTTYDCPDLYSVSGMLEESGVRDRIILNIGGAPITKQMADKMCCDVYGGTAAESVRAIKEAVLRMRKKS